MDENIPFTLVLTTIMFYHLSFVCETGSCYVAQVSLELIILLPQPLKCWDYRCAPLLIYLFDLYTF
jgi:hypothetical protein